MNIIIARDFSIYTSFLTNIPILTGLLLTMRKPQGMVYVFTAAIIICLLRIVTIFTVPLDPPTDIIPLRDVFIETFFYQGHVILKDLFFSGHTANLLLVAMLADILWLKRILVISAICVGTLVLLQHVHYTIDVFAAPFFAIMSYKAAVHIVNKYFLKEYPYGTRTGNILEEFGFRKEKLSAARR
ncbi:MAG: hypothetical protein IPM42_09175 [Saprospiraceae bacterium]|nr:hypothetical protein [Saprospiraceae bacterium]